MKRLLIWVFILLLCGVAYAATTTTNYGLYKPAVGDVDWGALINGNFDTIDSQMKTNADAISTHTSDNTQAHSDYLINNGNDSTSGTITAAGFAGNLTGNVTGNVSGTSGSTTGNAGTASALAANGGNCSSGNSPLGVDASGAVESCFDVWTEAENTSAGYAPLVSPSFTTPTLGVAAATSINKVTITTPATGSTLTIVDGKTLTVTNTVNLNTMTDGKICQYSSSGTVINCNVDAGAGDVTGAGDCASGACLDGSSDGGTYIRLHETATGFYGQVSASGLAGNTTYNLPQQNGTILTSGYLANSATLRGLLSDESGTGAAIFAGGNIGAATATTPAENDNDTSVATTAYVQTELAGLSAGEVNWDEMPIIMSAGVNWTDIELLAPINTAGINWTDWTDMTTGGEVVWGNIAEGELADSTVVSADIKDGTIAGGDLASNIAITSTGAQDFGGATSFEIPQDKTVDTDGQITIDGTTGQFRYHDGTAQRVLVWNDRRCFGWFDPADADDDIEVWTFKYAATVTNVSCRVSGGTSIAVVGGDGTNSFESITCDADGAADDGSITNATFTAGEVFELDLGAPSGTVPSFTYCIDFTNTAD